MKNYVLLLHLFASTCILAQSQDSVNLRLQFDGSVFSFEKESPSFYSYFKQREDSIFILVESVDFKQLAVVDSSGFGELTYSYDGQILHRYEIRSNKVDGVGELFHPNLLGQNHTTPYCRAVFKNNQLHGPVIFYDEQGHILKILVYKRGEFIRFIYHYLSQTEKDIRTGNEYAKDPFKD